MDFNQWVSHELGFTPNPFKDQLDIHRHYNDGTSQCKCIRNPDKYLTRVSDAVDAWDSAKVIQLYNNSTIPPELEGYEAKSVEMYTNTQLRHETTRDYLDFRKNLYSWRELCFRIIMFLLSLINTLWHGMTTTNSFVYIVFFLIIKLIDYRANIFYKSVTQINP